MDDESGFVQNLVLKVKSGLPDLRATGLIL